MRIFPVFFVYSVFCGTVLADGQANSPESLQNLYLSTFASSMATLPCSGVGNGDSKECKESKIGLADVLKSMEDSGRCAQADWVESCKLLRNAVGGQIGR